MSQPDRLMTLADVSAALSQAKRVTITVIIGDNSPFVLRIGKGEARAIVGHIRKTWGRKAQPCDIHASSFGSLVGDVLHLGGS